jgi:multimeric flavodoxin WrbA
MNIVIVNGENHKGSTYHIARQIADKTAALVPGSTIDEIWLPKDLPEFCCGCAKCVTDSETRCPHYKYMQPLTARVDAADLLILESPVYVFHCSGAMKAFLDHYAYRWMLHRPDGGKFTKQAVCVATAAGGGMNSAIRDMRDSLRWWGYSGIYTYGKAVAAINWDGVSPRKKRQIDAATTALAARITGDYGRIKPNLRAKTYFGAARIAQKLGWNKADQGYWKERGWTGRSRPWKAK